PDVDGHEEGFCVKIVEGVLSVWKHSTPSFFTSQGLGSSSTRRHKVSPPCEKSGVGKLSRDGPR
ncbi:hypothetical protein CSW21_11740, partial [Thermus scotoductus]